tara:strand:+ start:459 stop:599 length:141 start_codon:yes stop_codon:yes gene_type:complete
MAELNFNTEQEWKTEYNKANEQGETARAEFESNYGIDWAAYQVKSQ